MSEISKTDFEWAKKEAEPAMREILKRGLATDGVDPFREFVGGGYQQAIEYARIEKKKYVGEVGKRDGNYVYHFWLRDLADEPGFADKMGDAFIQVFKFPERIAAKLDIVMRCLDGQAEHEKDARVAPCGYWGSPDDFTAGCPQCGSANTQVTMYSWSVKVTGFADNPLADELASKVFDVFDQLLEKSA